MKLVRSLVATGMGVAILGSPAVATDFFVQAVQPGPISGTPLSAISLQATTEDLLPDEERGSAGTDTAEAPLGGESDVISGVSTYAVSTPKAKWVKARLSDETAVAANGGSMGSTPIPTEGSISNPIASKSGERTSQSAGTSSGATTVAGSTATGLSGSATIATTAVNNVSGPTPVQTSGQTYSSFGTLLKSGKIQGGDRVFLLDGYHGTMVIDGYKFSSPVLITSMPGRVAQVDGISVLASSNIIFENFKVWSSGNSNGSVAQIRTYSSSSDLTFRNLDVRTVPTATNYNQWTATDWTKNKRSGLLIDGARQTVVGNRITGVFHGIQSLGNSALVEYNIIDGFSGDAMRVLGDSSVLRGNKAQNCVDIFATHEDGIQSWSIGPGGKVGTGTIRNVTIEGNKLFEWVSKAANPLRCKLQGISLFDGMYDGFVIRNNLIATKHYHGISIAGALNTVIENNTIVDIDGAIAKWPWISVKPSRNGLPSSNVTVANNIVNGLKVKTDPSKGIVAKNNLKVSNAAAEFTSISNLDFSLTPSSKAVDSADPNLSPKSDILGVLRPRGKGPDIGAYESQ